MYYCKMLKQNIKVKDPPLLKLMFKVIMYTIFTEVDAASGE